MKIRYDYEITVNVNDTDEKTLRGSGYGRSAMVDAIEQHYPTYQSAVIVFTRKVIED